jgi:ubiquinone/menaquinone biosynthesis C-methylase UbiE
LGLPPSQLQRKYWEYVRIVHALEDAQMLDCSKRGMGLGTGAEVLCFHFANRAAEIVATDLFSETSDWLSARLSIEKAYERSPFPYRKERLLFRNMDMTAIDLPRESVDFVWSTSSIEHVNSIEQYLSIFRGIDRILIPGGTAAIVTEFNLRSESDYRPSLILVDAHLLHEVEQVSALRLERGLDLAIEDHPCNVPMNLDVLGIVPFWQHLPNIWAETKGALFTSALLIFRKDAALPRISGSELVQQDIVHKYSQIAEALKQRQVYEVRPEPKFTQCGITRQLGGAPALESNGQPGFLTFGPYVHLPTGRYRALMRLRLEQIPTWPSSQFRHALGLGPRVEADVALSKVQESSSGSDLIIASRASIPLRTGQHEIVIELPFETHSALRCEFRLCVPAIQGVVYLGTMLQPLLIR